MDIFILQLVSNQFAVLVKIDGSQQQDGTHVRHARDYKCGIFQGKNAKLGGVVLYVILEQ